MLVLVVHGTQDPCVSTSTAFALGRNSGGENAVCVTGDIAHTLEARAEVQAVQLASAVRRLTPIECERLQGFPDGYTLVPYRNKEAADGPRYNALGNSMAVPVMRFIGQRIADVLNAQMEKVV